MFDTENTRTTYSLHFIFVPITSIILKNVNADIDASCDSHVFTFNTCWQLYWTLPSQICACHCDRRISRKLQIVARIICDVSHSTCCESMRFWRLAEVYLSIDF